MSTNKNATIRYQALDKCFRNTGRKYFIEDLIEACNEALLDVDSQSSGVKRRQVFEDIKFMKDSRGYEAPIESYRDGKKTYYRYSDTQFSINSQPLNEQEAYQLKESLVTLSRFKGLPQFNWIDEIIARLEHTFKLKSQQVAISFEENPYLRGTDYISILFGYIINKIPLTINYQPFSRTTPLIHTIHPYFLKQYNNRWFLLGLNDELDRITNIALDRITSIEEAKITYKENNSYDFDEYFDDVIGVSVPADGKPEKIVLRVDNSLLPYIKTKPIHGSQKIRQMGDADTIVELKLIPNYEFEAVIFSHSDRIEVVEPASLRAPLKEKIERLAKRYN
ncbi:helix-turn-helix transcriptional regulator [Alistipes sp. ZOR0009]|uniref:helix-turn-helix transcriptional regulator n=1 Tax=Alistipes sp. ZOR0009 TaxID=1339253 RepID=UPI000648563F|nr:WYL domain-containing protein [Alistipes sp. ZOR0009]